MQDFLNWWGTISWAEISVGAIVTALIAGYVHLRGKTIEGKSNLSGIDRAHQKEVEKLRAEKLEAEHWLIVEKAQTFSYKLHELSTAVQTAGQTQFALRDAGHDENLFFAYDVSDVRDESDPGKLIGKHSWLELEWQRATETVEELYPLIDAQIQDLKAYSRDLGGKAEAAYHKILIVTTDYTSIGPCVNYKMGEAEDQNAALENFDAAIEQFKHKQIRKPE
ncbi:hypothetical protein [uncultured Kocuria sp.]|uniref:hypothetical protein n=1 Tax=uncultured Kocuria sp. TaxID=259305 RepID=UPI0026023A1F|nr:hypothetical protein [uncultured Kocuria sp.]